MYIADSFKITDEDEIFSFIETNPFGQLISLVQGKHFSSHIPFLLSEDKSKLIGHLAKRNPQYKELAGQEVLVTLEGPHDYISPSWYSSAGVPTWDYQAAHIYGKCETFDDTEKLRQIVDFLTDKHESQFSEPWQPNYSTNMLKAIVGIEVSINEIQCAYKLGQNRPEDQQQVANELEKIGSHKMAQAIKQVSK